jgi:branched-chain amino acid transport system substrate-binding protein
MVRIHTSRPVSRRVAALAGASVLLAACGAGGGGEDRAEAPTTEGSTVGVTDTAIKIGTHMPLTGVAAPGYSEIPTGAQAYFDCLNREGGVNGRNVEYTVRDDGYNPANTSQVTNQLVLQDEVFGLLGGLGTPTHSAVVDFLNEEKVPDLFVSSGALAWNQPEKNPFTFGWQPNYTVEGKIIGQYVKENFPNAKVGLFLQDDDFGRDGGNGAKQFLEDQIVSEVEYVPGNVDIGPQVAQLKADGADLVIGFNVPSYTALSQLTAQRLQYDPTWFYSNVGSDPTLVGALLDRFSKGAVKGGGALEDVYTTKYLPTVEDPDNPWTQFFTKVWEECGGDGEMSNFRLYGMAQAYTLALSLDAAGENVTREGIVDAIEKNGSEFKGPWLAPMEYSAESHRGITGVQVVQLKGGQFKSLTEIKTTDDGEGEIVDFTEAPAKPGDNGLFTLK